MALADLGKGDIEAALGHKDGNVAAAARWLGVDRGSLSKKIDALGLGHLKSNSRANGAAEEGPLDAESIAREQDAAERRSLRKQNRELKEALAKRETTIDRIVEAARVPVEVPAYRAPKPKSDLPVRSAILPIFDIQYGQLVKPTDVPLGKGGYGDSVFGARLVRYLDAVIRSLRDYAASHYIEELVFALGGDFVEGMDIFAGQAWQLDKDPARQVVDLTAHMAEALRVLIEFAKTELGVKRIMLMAVPGNHGKVGGKRAGAIPATCSWDWLFVRWLEDKLRAEPIDLWANEPAGALLFETAGHTFLMVHGDEIKGHSGLPFYGLSKFDGKAMRLAGTVYDYCLLGHHHQPASIPNGSGGEFIVSGDWVGGNNLSKFIVAASRPQQRILFVSRKLGLTENVPIYFTDSTARQQPHVYSTVAA